MMNTDMFLFEVPEADTGKRLRGLRATPLDDGRVCVTIEDTHRNTVSLFLDAITWAEIRKFFDGEPPTKKEETNESVEN